LKAPAKTGTFRLATAAIATKDRAKDPVDRNLGVDRAQLPHARSKELIERVMAATYHNARAQCECRVSARKGRAILSHARQFKLPCAEEYRHIAEELLRPAREAKTEDERKQFFDMVLSWSQAAALEERQKWIGSFALKQ
jgi:hypothetical protein